LAGPVNANNNKTKVLSHAHAQTFICLGVFYLDTKPDTAAYLISLNEQITLGENLYATLGNGACINCHGEKGLGGVEIGICSYSHGADCASGTVLRYETVKTWVANMGAYGPSNKPFLCADSVPTGANCSENVALYLKSLGWKRVRQ
jgi:hypothetical protein